MDSVRSQPVADAAQRHLPCLARCLRDVARLGRSRANLRCQGRRRFRPGELMLTVVMYHYVRELDGSSYPALKALTTAEFDRQLDFIEQHHTVIGWPELLAAVSGEAPLPMDACLLTFDDGLRDHYVNVIPRLARRSWTGCFFPSSAPVLDHVVLMVHKLH